MKAVKKVEEIEIYHFNFTKEELEECVKILDERIVVPGSFGPFHEFRKLACKLLGKLLLHKIL